MFRHLLLYLLPSALALYSVWPAAVMVNTVKPSHQYPVLTP